MLLLMLNGKYRPERVEVPLELTEQEEGIVDYPHSVFVLGRSGTGKSTVMIKRMFMKECMIRKLQQEEKPTSFIQPAHGDCVSQALSRA
mmetsp:Transcript_37818/g.61278  ORF Transcript_37818/g.61278 Transcript_37818/m.61278 type:complete len:89 (-) Transcript_37818:5960-6226(-)